MATLYTSENRIIKADHVKSLWKETADIVLSNHDQGLKDVDLRGKTVKLKWGMIIGGTPYSAPTGSLLIIDQLGRSQPGVLTHTVKCEGIASLLARDHASKQWECDADSTVRDLFEKIAAGSLSPFSHCVAYDIVLHHTDPTYETLKPGERFVIGLNENRRDTMRYLLDHTALFMRIERDDKLHLYKETELAYEYALDGEHTFFTKDNSTKAVLPNIVTVRSVELTDDGDYEYSGTDTDAPSVALYGDFPTFEQLNVQSNEEAATVAAAILANIKATERTVEAQVPMNCFADTFDKVKITDLREGSTVVEGHIGSLSRHFEPGVYRMRLTFGGWFNARKIRDFLKGVEVGQEEEEEGGAVRLEPLTASFPATRLAVAQQEPVSLEWSYDYYVFGEPIVPGKGRLYVKAWSMYAQTGYCELHIYVWTGEAWELVWYSEGDGFHKYEGQLIWTNPGDTEAPVQFCVYNPKQPDVWTDWNAENVTGMIAYDVKGPPSE